MKKPLDLGLISENETVKFDFKTKTVYVETFRLNGFKKEADGNSFMNTVWLGVVFIAVIGVFGKILDAFITIPPILGFSFACAIGYFPVKLLIEWLSKRAVAVSTRKASKKEIENVFGKRVGQLWVMQVGVWIVYVCLFFTFLISLSENRLKGGGLIAVTLGVLGFTIIQTTAQPRQSIKARKILKKQLKEGKFDV